jgi:hypothetical protein
MMTGTDDGYTIHLTSSDGHGTPEPIQHFSNHSGQCTLGVHLVPDGNDKDEFTYQMQQAKKMSNCIKSAPLRHEYISVGFRAIWKMMLQCPLGVTCFTCKQCQKLQAPYLPTFLSKMGINHTTSTAVQHGPRTLVEWTFLTSKWNREHSTPSSSLHISAKVTKSAK